MHYVLLTDVNSYIQRGPTAALRRQDVMMKSNIFENGLALFAALVILIGVFAAANTALVGNTGTVEIHGAAHI